MLQADALTRPDKDWRNQADKPIIQIRFTKWPKTYFDTLLIQDLWHIPASVMIVSSALLYTTWILVGLYVEVTYDMILRYSNIHELEILALACSHSIGKVSHTNSGSKCSTKEI